MPPPSRTVRGVQDIRTHSEKLGRGNETYQLYLRLGCLEMEASRRQKERDSAAERLRKIDSRLAAIDKEKEALRQSAGIRPGQLQADGTDTSTDDGGFKIRY